MPITNHDVAVALGATPDDGGGYRGSEYTSRGLPILAGCEVCGATLAPYNSHPTTTGYLRCGDCVDSHGFDSFGEYVDWLRATDQVPDGVTADPATWYTYDGQGVTE